MQVLTPEMMPEFRETINKVVSTVSELKSYRYAAEWIINSWGSDAEVTHEFADFITTSFDAAIDTERSRKLLLNIVEVTYNKWLFPFELDWVRRESGDGFTGDFPVPLVRALYRDTLKYGVNRARVQDYLSWLNNFMRNQPEEASEVLTHFAASYYAASDALTYEVTNKGRNAMSYDTRALVMRCRLAVTAIRRTHPPVNWDLKGSRHLLQATGLPALAGRVLMGKETYPSSLPISQHVETVTHGLVRLRQQYQPGYSLDANLTFG